MNSCCRSFGVLLQRVGEPGFSVILLKDRDAVFATLICRSASNLELGRKSIHYQWPIQYCPFCGMNLVGWSVANPEAARHWIKIGESKRWLVVPQSAEASHHDRR